MRISHLTLNASITLSAAVAALGTAWLAARSIENGARSALQSLFALEGTEWARVETDGLQVQLSGTAPTEADRFHVLSLAGSVVDESRVIDNMQVLPSAPVQAPDFSVEILRNDSGISVIGLIPAGSDRIALNREMTGIAGDTSVTDLLEVADYPVPDGWDVALDYALKVLAQLPRSKISVTAGGVAVTAIADSRDDQRNLETKLAREAPDAVAMSVHIRAPRPVISPFTLRFLKDADGARFDACSAHTEAGRDRILAAARDAGMIGKASCTLGLGVPSPTWPDAAVATISALTGLGGGSVTIADADITLIAPETTEPRLFDRVTSELEAALPEVFSLHAVLPAKAQADGAGESDGPPEFIATLSPEGQVQIRGRLSDERQRSATESFARARFGTEAVYAATRLDPDLPSGWSTRVLAGLEALALLSNGAVEVQPDLVNITGKTGNPDANAEISRLMSEKLGDAQDFRVGVVYVATLDPAANVPTPEECLARVNAIQDDTKITFDPGSADIVADARRAVDDIADVLKSCEDVPIEIAGYTDSQGREEMNKALSQQRAQAVLNALLARRVLTTDFVAVGYGEENPIADNGTDEGREANRRIEFSLIAQAQPDTGANPDGDAQAPADATENDPAAADGESAGSPDPAETDAAQQPDAAADNPGATAAPQRPADVQTEATGQANE